MIRKLKLINAKGETWDLNRESSFFHTLSGFGFEDATQYERIGTTFYPLDEILNQGRVDGSVSRLALLKSPVITGLFIFCVAFRVAYYQNAAMSHHYIFEYIPRLYPCILLLMFCRTTSLLVA